MHAITSLKMFSFSDDILWWNDSGPSASLTTVHSTLLLREANRGSFPTGLQISCKANVQEMHELTENGKAPFGGRCDGERAISPGSSTSGASTSWWLVWKLWLGVPARPGTLSQSKRCEGFFLTKWCDSVGMARDSPHLNVNENLWAILKEQIQKA